MRLLAVITFFLFSMPASAQEIRFIGKSVMFSDYRIIRSLLDSRDHKSFVRAARAVGLEQPLLQAGSMTVLAPTDAAFLQLPQSLQDRLVNRPGKDAVARVLACHIVTDPRFAGLRLADLLRDRDSISIPTLGSCVLTIAKAGNAYRISNGAGAGALVLAADIAQSNGMIQIIDKVILP